MLTLLHIFTNINYSSQYFFCCLNDQEELVRDGNTGYFPPQNPYGKLIGLEALNLENAGVNKGPNRSEAGDTKPDTKLLELVYFKSMNYSQINSNRG